MNSILAHPILAAVIAASILLLAATIVLARWIPTIKQQIYRWPPLWEVVRIFVLLVIVNGLIILIDLSRVYPATFTPLLLVYLASLIGAMVGAGELIARYRDAPFSALGRRPSALYLAVNAIAAGTAFLMINGFDWNFGMPAEAASVNAVRVLVAGFGAMALFRSSLFLARIGGKDVGVGPATILQIVLNAADAGVDRETAKRRAPVIKEIMEFVDPEKAKKLLPLFCYRLLQSSLPDDEFIAMNRKIEEIYDLNSGGPAGAEGITMHSKAYALGLIIMNYMGEDVLRAAVKTLGPEISLPQESPVPTRIAGDTIDNGGVSPRMAQGAGA